MPRGNAADAAKDFPQRSGWFEWEIVSAKVEDSRDGNIRLAKILMRSPEGSTIYSWRVDGRENPWRESRSGEQTTFWSNRQNRLLKALGIPEGYWEEPEEERDKFYEYDWEDLVGRRVMGKLEWSQPNDRYPKTRLELAKFEPVEGFGGTVGWDGDEKPAPYTPGQDDTAVPF